MVTLPGLDGSTDASIERTPDGRRIVVTRAVDAPAETCWDLLIDTEQWPAWGPSVSAVDCAERHVTGGTTGRVQVAGGPWLPFEITDCRDYRWTWRVARIPATGHFVRDGRQSRIGFEVPLAAAGYVPVCVRALQDLAGLVDGVANET
ncbi:SRPBCC family protein [Halorientalis marina]|uniref:SRPBCC family protein n=1 Tax=Halorientalis marina TaxID=2931976 RepID=UPI001FF4F512|nr:SRPBCC family protein [Halorientalis marina]